MPHLVILRHGQSLWNKDNRFTGWADVNLTDFGLGQARKAGLIIKKYNIKFQAVYTSKLIRSIATCKTLLDYMEHDNIIIQRKWRLNEKHYGILQGLNKKESSSKYGIEQVWKWRRFYNERPSPMDTSDSRHPIHDPKYAKVCSILLPSTESLRDVYYRILPIWDNHILPDILNGKNVLVCAHGNSLRALIKHIRNISDSDISNIEIPNSAPFIYHYDDKASLDLHENLI